MLIDNCFGRPMTHPPAVGTASSKNIFDNLPALQAPKPAELHGEVDRYLSTDPEHVTDVLVWWYEHKHIYPCLHRMALDYLSIPGTSLICLMSQSKKV